MTKYTIELSDNYIVEMRNGASVEAETAKLEALLPNIFAYGLGQVLRDSASGASKAAEAEGSQGVQAEAQAMMDAKLSGLYEGQWSQRGEGGSVDPRVAIARSLVRSAMKAKLGKDSKDWAKFMALSDDEQLAKLDENYAANESIFAPMVEAKLAEREAARKAKAKAASAVSFKL